MSRCSTASKPDGSAPEALGVWSGLRGGEVNAGRGGRSCSSAAVGVGLEEPPDDGVGSLYEPSLLSANWIDHLAKALVASPGMCVLAIQKNKTPQASGCRGVLF